MQDLTTGSLSRHLLKTTSFMLVMMVFQTLYFLVDLYWVGRLGTEAVAGVSIAGNISFLTLAIGQMLGVGTTTVVSHAVGRRDQAEARHLFHQALLLATAVGALFLVLGLALLGRYTRALGADARTAALAADYLRWFVPAMALQFPLGAMGAALRATGNFRPTMLVSTASVVLNMALAPFLIFGWGTGRAYGVAGAAISSLVAIVVGLAWLGWYFVPETAYLRFDADGWRPRPAAWRRMLGVGLPAGFEFSMMALYQFVVYTVALPFGAAAQAGFGVGMRVIQAGFMPVVALGFAVAPVAGQNFGAGRPERVRATFRQAALMASGVMALFAVLSHVAPDAMIRTFSDDPALVAVGSEYLRIISWNYVASGLIFVASSMFQAMGNTIPSLVASGARMALVIVPTLVLSRQPGFRLTWVWLLAVTSVYVQLALSLWLLRREFGRRLGAPALSGAGLPAASPPPIPATSAPSPAPPAADRSARTDAA
ncbi:MATE family efflux transporter [Roseisolibacter sp. H3M3-2]|uniref:MATE family efflux transporter n=1 Tax=Roseisolibacter sp. H3M3-2 TaxID=3031323 RepID=UPI0023D99F9C|nr:MATE family efflux transporter [Roseisolibacter sp. H3M3-2]MDF1504770.1 MATE family efflux transporter [Roseisolibacter sp. H3M3-2]